MEQKDRYEAEKALVDVIESGADPFIVNTLTQDLKQISKLTKY